MTDQEGSRDLRKERYKVKRTQKDGMGGDGNRREGKGHEEDKEYVERRRRDEEKGRRDEC